MPRRTHFTRTGCAALTGAALALLGAGAAGEQGPPAVAALRVCADPANLPQSNDRGEGYENKIAAALARDLKRRLEYTYFPQRMGFVRNTLRARDETTQQFKCDLIIGVPRGYELTATTRPYLHSTYALLFAPRGPLVALHEVGELAALPAGARAGLRIGAFARTPAADWLLANGFIDQALFYPPQSGDPQETVASIVTRDLAAGRIDAAILWGPIAGYLASYAAPAAGAWVVLPFPTDARIRFDYEIAMGVRFGEQPWLDMLDRWIGAHQGEIDEILASYHVPRLALTAPGG